MIENDEDPVDLAADMFGEDPDAPSTAYPELTNRELDEIRAKARKTVADDLKAEQKALALKQEIAQAKREAGMSGFDLKTDMVNIHVDLPEYCANAKDVGAIRIDGRVYTHGFTYTVPRHQADSIRDQMYRAWLHQRDIDGKSLAQFYERSKSMGGIRSLNKTKSVSMKTGAVQ